MSLNAPSGRPCERGSLASLPDVPPLPDTAGKARGHVLGVLQDRADSGAAAVGERVLGDVLLVVSELFTNALRHGGGVTLFEVRAGAHEISVSVGDRSTDLPATPSHRRTRLGTGEGIADGRGGYGWSLVRELADMITLVLQGDGKVITVRLPLTDTIDGEKPSAPEI
ncbi:ATP-binding protein [Streptomyces sp. A1499]|uniref:ATP-binding protein n=1 Tax=Streptomyces sp. A1499 TaxID=2563104 RepID=UPI00109EDBFC|nr:ATP-binding protein [Streptomyces sp. A1499]THC51950.1 ATP-binding protein [Streptomyces sp. A1499]